MPTPEQYKDYYTHIEQADQQIIITGDPTSYAHAYEVTLNLPVELQGLPAGAIIYDLGSGTAEATEGLAELHPELKFVAINPNDQRSGAQNLRRERSVPYIIGTAEDLIDPQSTTRQQLGKLYPPQMVIARNMMKDTITQTTVDLLGEQAADDFVLDIFTGILSSIPIGGKLLIYDQTGEATYPFYENYLTAFEPGSVQSTRVNNLIPADEVYGGGKIPCHQYLSITRLK